MGWLNNSEKKKIQELVKKTNDEIKVVTEGKVPEIVNKNIDKILTGVPLINYVKPVIKEVISERIIISDKAPVNPEPGVLWIDIS